ncbi:MAG: ATP-binding protein, partial [Thermodesulfobacteriota bacterium]
SGLDKAIHDDLTPQEYPLENFDKRNFTKYTENHKKGTIILFKDIKGGIRNSLGILKKVVALYFRFSLIDKTFNIFIDDEKIDFKHLAELADKTEFLWTINDLSDPFIDKHLKNLIETKGFSVKGSFKGFIASVKKPRDLAIMGLEERVSVDLFVNGRLREKNILKHIPTSRIVEDYIYGQIHFNGLDDTEDRFTSDREGVVADDTKYQLFLKNLLDDVVRVITDDWDKWRIKHREDGDPENKRFTRKERKSAELYNVVSEDYSPPKGSRNKDKIDGWVDGLASDATYNLGSYAECFVAENLIRKYILDNKIELSAEAKKIVEKWKEREKANKEKGN